MGYLTLKLLGFVSLRAARRFESPESPAQLVPISHQGRGDTGGAPQARRHDCKRTSAVESTRIALSSEG